MDSRQEFLLQCAAITKGGIRVDESFRKELNHLQKERLIYIENRVIRITYKAYCLMFNKIPKSTLSNCVLVPRHIMSSNLYGNSSNCYQN